MLMLVFSGRAMAVEGGIRIALCRGPGGSARRVGLVVVVLRSMERCRGSSYPHAAGWRSCRHFGGR